MTRHAAFGDPTQPAAPATRIDNRNQKTHTPNLRYRAIYHSAQSKHACTLPVHAPKPNHARIFAFTALSSDSINHTEAEIKSTSERKKSTKGERVRGTRPRDEIVLVRRSTGWNARWINAHPLVRLPALPSIRCAEHQHANPAATLGNGRDTNTTRVSFLQLIT